MISIPSVRRQQDPKGGNQFSEHLLADETILWAARAKAPAVGLFAVLFPIILGVIALGIGAEIVFHARGLSVFAILLLAVSGYIFWKTISVADDLQHYYAITNYRAIKVSNFLGDSIATTFTPYDIQFRIKLRRADGSGSLFFGREIEETDQIAGKFFEIKNTGFAHIPEVDAAEQAMEALLDILSK